MRYAGIYFLILLGLVCCKPADDESSAYDDAAYGDASGAIGTVREEMRDVYEAARSYTFEQRADLETWTREQIDGANVRLERVEESMRDAGEDAKLQWQETAATLRPEVDELQAKLDELGRSTAETWQDTKSEVVTAARDLNQRLEDALAELDEDDPDR